MNQKNLDLITELRHELHRNAELSGQEYHTKQLLMEFIETHTRLKVEDQGKWFYAVLKEGDSVSTPKAPIAFRAEMDALPMEEKLDLPYASNNPGAAHKCGHDGHCAALAGLALELEVGAGSWERDIYLIFQHAEEIGAGGAECAQFIKKEGISEIYAFHNWSDFPEHAVVVRDGIAQCASKGLTIYLEGTPSHASEPEHGINPAEAVSELVLAIKEETVEPGYKGLVMATIVHIEVGSKNFGISASKGQISITLRAEYERDFTMLEEEIRTSAEEVAEEFGLQLSFEESDVFPDTVNDADATEHVRKAAKEHGLEVVELEESIRGSEDFGYYLKECPGAIFYIGNGEDYAQLHTSEYDFNDQILNTAVDMFIGLL
ncbi:MAG: M20 family metallopeptidase [Brotaphodocola sp.]